MGREVLRMRCPKCGYTSFAYLETCGKCGRNLAEAHEAFGLYARRPTPPDLTAYVAATMEGADALEAAHVTAALSIDLSQLDEIGVEAMEMPTQAPPLPVETPAEPVQPTEIDPGFALEPEQESQLLGIEPAADAAKAPEEPGSQPIDLTQLDEIELEMEVEELEVDEQDDNPQR